MKNYKELEIKCRAFAELQAELKEMIEIYTQSREVYADRNYTYDEEQWDMLGAKINAAEKLLEHLDKVF